MKSVSKIVEKSSTKNAIWFLKKEMTIYSG